MTVGSLSDESVSPFAKVVSLSDELVSLFAEVVSLFEGVCGLFAVLVSLFEGVVGLFVGVVRGFAGVVGVSEGVVSLVEAVGDPPNPLWWCARVLRSGDVGGRAGWRPRVADSVPLARGAVCTSGGRGARRWVWALGVPASVPRRGR